MLQPADIPKRPPVAEIRPAPPWFKGGFKEGLELLICGGEEGEYSGPLLQVNPAAKRLKKIDMTGLEYLLGSDPYEKRLKYFRRAMDAKRPPHFWAEYYYLKAEGYMSVSRMLFAEDAPGAEVYMKALNAFVCLQLAIENARKIPGWMEANQSDSGLEKADDILYAVSSDAPTWVKTIGKTIMGIKSHYEIALKDHETVNQLKTRFPWLDIEKGPIEAVWGGIGTEREISYEHVQSFRNFLKFINPNHPNGYGDLPLIPDVKGEKEFNSIIKQHESVAVIFYDNLLRKPFFPYIFASDFDGQVVLVNVTERNGENWRLYLKYGRPGVEEPYFLINGELKDRREWQKRKRQFKELRQPENRPQHPPPTDQRPPGGSETMYRPPYFPPPPRYQRRV